MAVRMPVAAAGDVLATKLLATTEQHPDYKSTLALARALEGRPRLDLFVAFSSRAALEGVDEVRVLVDSLLLHGGVFTADKSIKLAPSKSVLGLEFGDTVALSEAQFVRLFDAFFHEIEANFSAGQLAATAV